MLLAFAAFIRRKSSTTVTSLRSEVQTQATETKINTALASAVRDKGKEKEDQQETKEEKQKRLEAAARVKDATAQAIRKKQQINKKLSKETSIAGLPPGQKLSKR